jgi:hypothetical protein
MSLPKTWSEYHGINAESAEHALAKAAGSGRIKAVRAMLGDGVDISARENHVAGLEVLARNGADPAKQCLLPWAKGGTALGLAQMEKKRDAVKFLESLQARKRLN